MGKGLALFNEVTREVAAARGLLLVDVAAAMPSDSRYFYDWTHYSKEGAAVLAGIFADRIVPYLEERHPDRRR